MNKVILGLILAVCVLGMALVMLNERLGRQTDIAASQTQSMAENKVSPERDFPETPVNVNPPLPPQTDPVLSPMPSPDGAEAAARHEEEEARAALAPPEPPREESPALPALPPKASIPAAPKPAPALPKAAQNEKPAPEKTAPEKPAAPEKPVIAAADKGKDKTISRFVIFSREKGATIRIGGGSRIHYNSMTLDNPDRIVVDMDGQWQFPPNPGVPKNDIVSNVRIGKNGEKTRVVIDLKEKARVVRILPSKNGDSMDIRVDK